jgi:hypothetical protein
MRLLLKLIAQSIPHGDFLCSDLENAEAADISITKAELAEQGS